MTRAVVLSAGSSWAAYQMGALEHLCAAADPAFDLYAGAGIGAMNAAFAACGKVDALAGFWDTASMRSLVRFNARSFWKAPLSSAPQRAFVQRHVTEQALAERGVTLSITALDLRNGSQVVLRYPGASVPLVDGVMAAVATPGLLRPADTDGHLLAEATLVDSVPMVAVAHLRRGDEIVAVLPSLPHSVPSSRAYTTWLAVLERALAMNLAHDVRRAISNHDEDVRFADAAARAVAAAEALSGHIDDPQLAHALQQRMTQAVAPLRDVSVPTLTAIVPSRQLDFPLWRFRPAQVAFARTLGFTDAGGRLP